MKTDKEKLTQILLLDMQHWSVNALKEALLFADGKCLEPSSADDLRWWWKLRKAIRMQLDVKKVAQNES